MNRAEKNKVLSALNYMSAQVGLMCLRDYSDWKGTACPCPECIE